MKAILDSGAIGEPSWARISFRTGYDIYKGQPYFYDEERFVILDLGVHVVDVARFLLGEVERVSCETQRRNPKVKAEDTATMLLRHTSGAVSIVEATYETKKLPDSFPETMLEIEGPRGAIVTKPGYRMRGHRRRQADEERDRDSAARTGRSRPGTWSRRASSRPARTSSNA